jgi:hypothetical protein
MTEQSKPFEGLVRGKGRGRHDTVHLKIVDGSYVVPADVVSAIGEGNSEAGDYLLSSMFMLEAPQTSANVDVLCSCGEWIVRPDKLVLHFRVATLSEAHDEMDAQVIRWRREYIQTLGELPRPTHCVLPDEKPRRRKRKAK